MLRAHYSFTMLFLFACNHTSAKPDPTSSVTASAAASAAPRPSAVAATSASTKPAGDACAALEWDKDGMNAKATTFKGKIGNGEGTNGRAETEKFQTLVLDKPACGPDKAPVDEVQLYTNDKTIDLKKMAGKSVTIDGEPFASHTAHHHRPIVVEVKKLTAN